MRYRLLAIFLWLFLAFPLVVSSADMDSEDKDLERLTINEPDILQVPAGESLKLSIGRIGIGSAFEESTLPVVWSVDSVEGVLLNPRTGELSYESKATEIKILEVKADVDNGRKSLSKKLYLYNSLATPLIRNWRERSRLNCADGKEIIPARTIGELEFRADGKFYVTWRPFEFYHDYWGSYSVDYNLKKLELKPTGGNYLPKDIVPKGYFEIGDKGNLIISGIYLGTGKRFPDPEVSCGHIFK